MKEVLDLIWVVALEDGQFCSKSKNFKFIDPSTSAIKVAIENLKYNNNCEFKCSTISQTNLDKNSQDFGYCLGVPSC